MDKQQSTLMALPDPELLDAIGTVEYWKSVFGEHYTALNGLLSDPNVSQRTLIDSIVKWNDVFEEDSDQSNHSVNDFMSLLPALRHHALNAPIYEISDALIMQLDEVELDSLTPQDVVHAPAPAMYLKFGDKGIYNSSNNSPFDVIYGAYILEFVCIDNEYYLNHHERNVDSSTRIYGVFVVTSPNNNPEVRFRHGSSLAVMGDSDYMLSDGITKQLARIDETENALYNPDYLSQRRTAYSYVDALFLKAFSAAYKDAMSLVKIDPRRTFKSNLYRSRTGKKAKRDKFLSRKVPYVLMDVNA